MQRRTAHSPAANPRAGRGRRIGILLAAGGTLLALPVPAAVALAVQTTSINATEGSPPFSGTVATVTDLPAVGCPPPAPGATVAWADGTSSPASFGTGTLSTDTLSCTYPVNAAHSFAEEGTETFHVSVPGLLGGAADGTAIVTDAPITALGRQLATPAGALLGATAATFTDPNPGAGPEDFTATVAWGDGTPPAAAVVAADPAGGFTVRAAHTYPTAGAFITTIVVRDDGGSAGSATGGVTVAPPTPATTRPPPPPQPPPAATVPGSVVVSTPSIAGPRSFSLRITCPPGPPCRGVGRVVTLPGQAKKSPLPGGTILGSALFLLTSGQARTLSIVLPPRLRRALHHAHSARVAGVAIAFGAGGHSAVRTGPIAEIATTRLH